MITKYCSYHERQCTYASEKSKKCQKYRRTYTGQNKGTNIPDPKVKTLECSRCKKTKSVNFFNMDSQNLTGYKYMCKECQAETDVIRRNSKKITKVVKKLLQPTPQNIMTQPQTTDQQFQPKSHNISEKDVILKSLQTLVNQNALNKNLKEGVNKLLEDAGISNVPSSKVTEKIIDTGVDKNTALKFKSTPTIQKIVKTEKQLHREELQKLGKKACTNKNCKKAGELQDLNNFRKKNAAYDGYQSYCNACMLAAKQASRNKDKLKGKFVCPKGYGKEYQLQDSLTRHIKEKHS